jgi:hypothetical protein
LIVFYRSAAPPGRQKDMMVMEPIRPRFGSGGGVPPFQPAYRSKMINNRMAQPQRLYGTNPDRPGFSVGPKRISRACVQFWVRR